jgi:lysozyme family protein
MNTTDILDNILNREGQGTPPDYLSKNDAGGRTTWGISERSHPEAWVNGPPTKAQARQILLKVYVTPFFPLAIFGNDKLVDALVDDGVMSGVPSAVKRLQWVLGVTMDGTVGSKTIEAVRVQAGAKLLQKYVIERAVRITRLVERRPTDLTNLTGWITRILTFLPEVGV